VHRVGHRRAVRRPGARRALADFWRKSHFAKREALEGRQSIGPTRRQSTLKKMPSSCSIHSAVVYNDGHLSVSMPFPPGQDRFFRGVLMARLPCCCLQWKPSFSFGATPRRSSPPVATQGQTRRQEARRNAESGGHDAHAAGGPCIGVIPTLCFDRPLGVQKIGDHGVRARV